MAVGYKKKKTKILKEVPFEEEKIEEAAPVEDGVLTKDQFFQKVQQRPMSAHGIETDSYTHLTLPTILRV